MRICIYIINLPLVSHILKNVNELELNEPSMSTITVESCILELEGEVIDHNSEVQKNSYPEKTSFYAERITETWAFLYHQMDTN